MDLETFLRILLRYWWLLILATGVTTATTAYVVSQQEPRYRAATVAMLRANPALTDSRLQIDAQNSLERRTLINTIAHNATTSSMQDRVARSLGVPADAVKQAELTAIVIPETNLIEIRAQSTNPVLAAAIANTVAQELTKQVPAEVIQMEIIDEAAPPTAPFEPQPMRMISLSMVFGLVLGVSFAMLGYFLSRGQVAGAQLPSALNYGTPSPQDTAELPSLDETDSPPSGGRAPHVFTQ